MLSFLVGNRAQIAERFVQGQALQDIAQDLDSAIDTVLKYVFAKTGVNRHAELVAKIMAMPVWLQRHGQSAPRLPTGH